jgi:uncharacterized protein
MLRLMLTMLLLLALHAMPLAAAEESAPNPQVMTDSFLHAHPDLKYRNRGLKAYEAGDYAAAFRDFKRAARFADKASQAMLAEMLSRGEGVESDPVAAYAWMDLAAERHYRSFLLRRETLWESLDESQREAAIAIGEGIYAEYGDVVAKPRLVSRLRRERAKTTGSRTGFVGSLSITVQTLDGNYTIDGSTYYNERYWNPESYFAWQDRVWNAPSRGRVDIGPLEAAPEAGAAPGQSAPDDEAG